MTWNLFRDCISLVARTARKPIRYRKAQSLWLEPLEDRTLLSTVNWIGGSGDWSNPNNWLDASTMTNHTPTASDDAVINVPGITVTHSSGPDSIHSLNATGNTFVLSGGTLSVAAGSRIKDATLSGGLLSGSGDLTVTGNFAWDSGSMTGSGSLLIDAGAQVTIQGGGEHGAGRLINSSAGPLNWSDGIIRGSFTNVGTLNVSGDAAKRLFSGTLTKSGTTVWSGTGGLQLFDGAAFINQSDALFEARNDFTVFLSASGPAGVFTNLGTFRKTAGSGATTFASDIVFNSSGVVDVQSGTLTVDGPGTSSGTYTAAEGATFNLFSSTRTVAAGTTFAGDGSTGSAHFSAGMTLAGDVSTSGNVMLDGGTVSGTGNLTVSSGTFTWNGGTMSGPGSLIIATGAQMTIQSGGEHGAGRLIDSTAGPLNWVDGIIRGSFTNVGTLNVSGSAAKRLFSGTLTKSGTTVWSGTGGLQLYDGATFLNQATAVFEASNDFTVFLSASGPAGYSPTWAPSARRPAAVRRCSPATSYSTPVAWWKCKAGRWPWTGLAPAAARTRRQRAPRSTCSAAHARWQKGRHSLETVPPISVRT